MNRDFYFAVALRTLQIRETGGGNVKSEITQFNLAEKVGNN